MSATTNHDKVRDQVGNAKKLPFSTLTLKGESIKKETIHRQIPTQYL